MWIPGWRRFKPLFTPRSELTADIFIVADMQQVSDAANNAFLMLI
jgi:hypothetical protein